MRFMTLYKPGRETDTPPSEEEMCRVGNLIEEMARAGVLVMTDGLQSSRHGARVRYEDGKTTVTDGPFTETKELVAGYAILQTNSKEEAIEWTRRFLEVMGEGESEVRLMHDLPAYVAEEQQPAQTAAHS